MPRTFASFTAALPLALLLVFAGSSLSLAQDSPRLEGPVTDLVGAVAGSEGDIEAAIMDLQASSDVQLWVLYDDTTGDVPAPAYADQVAAANDLGVGDALYVVAMEDRSYALWISDSLVDEVTLEEQDEILLAAEDRLRDGDPAGAAVAVAEGLAKATGAEADGGGGGFGLVLVLIVAIALVGGIVLFMRRLRSGATAQANRDQVAKQANSLLLETDEALKEARSELGFVEAMYGPDEVSAYTTAIDEAAAELVAAFEIRQKLDDAEPEDDAAEERMLGEIVERATRAKDTLARQQEALRQLRALEQEAPRLLAALAPQASALEARLPAADASLATLEGYAPSNWEAVRGNRVEAQKRIDFARKQVAEGEAALASGEGSRAALCVREGTQAVTEATTLLDAIDGAVRELGQAQARMAAEIAEAETDIATARAMASAGGASGAQESPARLAEAEALLDEARRLSAASPLDVLGALQRADAAETIADELVAGVRQAEEALARQRSMLEGALTSAQARLELASGYVMTRRHGVGVDARTRVAEAERHLATARGLAATDPQSAIAEARRAEQLADEAYRLASADFDGWDQRSPMGGTMGAPMGGGQSDGGFAGALIGSILGSILSGSGPGAGWGGSTWGSPGGGGGGRPSPRFPSSGGSRRSSGGSGGGRSSGGRSSGGGRSRGGRW